MKIRLFLVICSSFTISFLMTAACGGGKQPGENDNNNNNNENPCHNRECGVFEGMNCGTCTGNTEQCNDQGQCIDLCEGYDCGHVRDNEGKAVSCGECTGDTERCKTNPGEGGLCHDYCADRGRECGGYIFEFDCGPCSSHEERCETEFGKCVHVCEGRECGSPVDGVECGECEQGKECSIAGHCYTPSSGCPEGMVLIEGKGYCIDAYEVTNGQFVDFLNYYGNDCQLENHHSVIQDYRCYNQEASEQIVVEEGVWEVVEGMENYPVGGVGYLGAKYACEMWGKQICSLDMWETACSGPGELSYPYGDTFDPCVCNMGAQSEDCFTGNTLDEVGSYPECEGGYTGIYDIHGNVAEIVDHCIWGWETFGCLTMGGYAGLPEYFAGCFFQELVDRRWVGMYGTSNKKIGFRCCYKLE